MRHGKPPSPKDIIVFLGLALLGLGLSIGVGILFGLVSD